MELGFDFSFYYDNPQLHDILFQHQGDHVTYGHRAILGGRSPYWFDYFSRVASENQPSGVGSKRVGGGGGGGGGVGSVCSGSGGSGGGLDNNLSGGLDEDENSGVRVIKINITDPPHAFRKVLSYIYTGKVTMEGEEEEEMDQATIRACHQLASRYKLPELELMMSRHALGSTHLSRRELLQVAAMQSAGWFGIQMQFGKQEEKQEQRQEQKSITHSPPCPNPLGVHVAVVVDGVRFICSPVVLAARSTFFRAMFHGRWRETASLATSSSSSSSSSMNHPTGASKHNVKRRCSGSGGGGGGGGRRSGEHSRCSSGGWDGEDLDVIPLTMLNGTGDVFGRLLHFMYTGRLDLQRPATDDEEEILDEDDDLQRLVNNSGEGGEGELEVDSSDVDEVSRNSRGSSMSSSGRMDMEDDAPDRRYSPSLSPMSTSPSTASFPLLSLSEPTNDSASSNNRNNSNYIGNHPSDGGNQMNQVSGLFDRSKYDSVKQTFQQRCQDKYEQHKWKNRSIIPLSRLLALLQWAGYLGVNVSGAVEDAIAEHYLLPQNICTIWNLAHGCRVFPDLHMELLSEACKEYFQQHFGDVVHTNNPSQIKSFHSLRVELLKEALDGGNIDHPTKLMIAAIESWIAANRHRYHPSQLRLLPPHTVFNQTNKAALLGGPRLQRLRFG